VRIGWIRESITARVSVVVILAGLSALTVGTVTALRLVGQDKEASLVEGVVDLATQRGAAVRHRITLARAELRAVVLAVAADRILEVPRLAEASATAVLASREGEEVLEVSRNEAALASLRAAEIPNDTELVRRGDSVVIREASGEVEVLSIVDLGPLLDARSGWTVELIDPADAPQGARGVVAHRYQLDGEDRASAVATTGRGVAVRVDAPLAPARAAALGISRRMLLWSWISLIPLFLLAWLFSRAVTRPISSLAATVREHGPDEQLALPPVPPDEIGELARAIETMNERLVNDLRGMRAAVRFSRHGVVQAPADLLAQLAEALSEAGSGWEVLETPAAEVERRLVAQGTERAKGSVPPGAAMDEAVRFSDGTVLFSLRPGTDELGCVLGSDAPEERDVRMAELLVRTAVERLHTLELTQKALVNEKLTALGRLSAGVAHEMNTPLAFLSANLHALSRETEGEALAMVEDARLGVERLTRIVRDLSGISKGGDAIVTEEVEATELAEHVARMCRSRADSGTIVVESQGPGLVFCDRGRLEQVLLNLVNNALDALLGREDARVEIVVGSTEHGVSFEIGDNGPGIDEAARLKLFDAFFTTKGRYGTGLGLYLSRIFVESHDGTLELVSSGPEGTRFRVTLPRGHEVERERVLPRRRSLSTLLPRNPDHGRPRILVVDDEPAILRAMKRWLKTHADVTGTTDPAKALAMVEAGARFDLILCDLDMPGMTGTEFVGALREASPKLAERVVIVTGSMGDPPDGLPVVRKPLTASTFSEILEGL